MSTRRLIIGIIVVVLGALLLVDAMGYIDFAWFWHQEWKKYILPVLVLIIGAKIVASANSHHVNNELSVREFEQPGNESNATNGKKQLIARAAFSGGQYVMNGKDFPGAKLDIFMGGMKLDLRGAKIEDGCVIDVQAFMGGMELFVSPEIRVEVRSNCFCGGVGNHVVLQPLADAKTIVLNANCCFGGIDIKG